MIHLQGMGLIGSLIALALERDEIPFSWDDNDAVMTAWRASTGCVFPTGDQNEISNYHLWLNWLHAKDSFGEAMRTQAERGIWTYLSAAPPHDGRRVGVMEVERIGGLAISNMSSLHVNVPQLVLATRERFSAHRVEERPRGVKAIVTHGFRNAAKYGWGWSRQLKLRLSEELQETLAGARPCLYLRKGYVMHYAYPMPRTQNYIVGTQNVQQKLPRRRDTEEPWLRWIAHLEDTIGDHVRIVKEVGPIVEGWRPYPQPDQPLLTEKPAGWICQPQAGNGLRSFPRLYNAVLEAVRGD